MLITENLLLINSQGKYTDYQQNWVFSDQLLRFLLSDI